MVLRKDYLVTNKQDDKLNYMIHSKFNAQSHTYYLMDTVLKNENAVHFPTAMVFNQKIKKFFVRVQNLNGLWY